MHGKTTAELEIKLLRNWSRSISWSNFIKRETLTKAFSCKFCEILRVIFYRTPLVGASVFLTNDNERVEWNDELIESIEIKKCMNMKWFSRFGVICTILNGEVFLLLTLQTLACNFTKINTPSSVFFTFFKLCKWYQIAERIRYDLYCCVLLPIFKQKWRKLWSALN